MLKQDDKKSRKTQSLINVLQEEHCLPKRPRTLVVGCGDGCEAGIIARQFGGVTDGIDLGEEFVFDSGGSYPATLKVMDAHHLSYPDGTFDFVFSFHALEHMADPDRVLREMNRVLKPGGVFLVGTPNSRRLIGYLGSATSIVNKVRWNFADWRMRLTGKWSNALGAHAGFSENELAIMCEQAFSSRAKFITRHYYRNLYGPSKTRIIYLTGLAPYILPCVYVFGITKST